jgi:Cu+-exporting ATPase
VRGRRSLNLSGPLLRLTERRHIVEDKDKQVTIDPVCEMEVTPENAACSHEYKGKTYYFCAASCKHEFVQDPESFLRH